MKKIQLDVPFKTFLRELWGEVMEDDIFNGAAVLGFFLTLAIFPAMIVVMAVIPYLPIANVDVAIMDALRQALPASAAEMFAGVVQEVTREQRGGLLSAGLLGALWATSSGMYAVMQQLNIAYDVQETRGFLKARAVAVGLSLLFSLLMLTAFSLIVLGGVMQEWLIAQFHLGQGLLVLFIVFRWAVIVLGLAMAFALVYYLAPDVEQEFVFITPGSIVGVLLLMIASLAFAWYAQNLGDYEATYGSIGAVIVLMLWLYIAGLAILFGSEINALVEHHSPQGKDKGEHEAGEKQAGVNRAGEVPAGAKPAGKPRDGSAAPRRRGSGATVKPSGGP